MNCGDGHIARRDVLPRNFSSIHCATEQPFTKKTGGLYNRHLLTIQCKLFKRRLHFSNVEFVTNSHAVECLVKTLLFNGNFHQ